MAGLNFLWKFTSAGSNIAILYIVLPYNEVDSEFLVDNTSCGEKNLSCDVMASLGGDVYVCKGRQVCLEAKGKH